MSASERSTNRRNWLLLIGVFFAGVVVMIAIGALLLNVQERKVEALEFPLKVAPLNPGELDPATVTVESIMTPEIAGIDLQEHGVHDDDLRRGRPTVHKAFDEATAILVGDALQSLAFEHLLARPEPRAAELGRLLARNASLMVEGQARDMDGEGARLDEAQVMELMRTKTGALLAASVAGGALAAGASAEAAYPWGLKLGLAFQIVDDLIDAVGAAAEAGKDVGQDSRKTTFVSFAGRDGARALAEELIAVSTAALSPFGPRAAPLRELARYVVTRRR